MVAAIDAAHEAGDTLGGTFEMWATGVPIGLGSHVQWDRKLDGQLAQAVMSIHAVEGRRDRRRVRGRRRPRLAGARRHPAAGQVGRPPVASRDEPCRWPRGRHDQRRARRRAWRAEADLDALQAAAVRRPASRRGDHRPTTSAPTSAPSPRPASSARRWSPSSWPVPCSKSSAATRWTRRAATSRPTRRPSARGLRREPMTYELPRAAGYLVSTDASLLDIGRIHAFPHRQLLGRGVPRETVARSIGHSIPFGLYDGHAQIGFARAVTDLSTFAYVADVYVEEEHQGQGPRQAPHARIDGAP